MTNKKIFGLMVFFLLTATASGNETTAKVYNINNNTYLEIFGSELIPCDENGCNIQVPYSLNTSTHVVTDNHYSKILEELNTTRYEISEILLAVQLSIPKIILNESNKTANILQNYSNISNIIENSLNQSKTSLNRTLDDIERKVERSEAEIRTLSETTREGYSNITHSFTYLVANKQEVSNIPTQIMMYMIALICIILIAFFAIRKKKNEITMPTEKPILYEEPEKIQRPSNLEEFLDSSYDEESINEPVYTTQSIQEPPAIKQEHIVRKTEVPSGATRLGKTMRVYCSACGKELVAQALKKLKGPRYWYAKCTCDKTYFKPLKKDE